MATKDSVAVSVEEVSRLSSQLNELVHGYSGIRDTQKKNAIRAKAKQIIAATQDPDTQWEDHLVQFAQLGVIREFVHLNVFSHIPPSGSISFKQLADKVNADPRLIARMSFMLTATDILKLEGQDRVSHTPLSQVYLDKHPTGLMSSVLVDEMNVPCSRWPEYFDKYGLTEPGNSPTLCPHTYAWGEPDKHFWFIMSESARRVSDFNNAMSLLEHVQPCTGMYDFGSIADVAKKEPDMNRKLLVDVGGGRGTTLQTIISTYPGIDASRCVLQDRPDVIEHTKQSADPTIQSLGKVPIDFLQESPIPGMHKKFISPGPCFSKCFQCLTTGTGAVAYYIRRCLHDWSDEVCAQILANIRKVCAPDSKVFITEQLLTIPPVAHHVAMDICVSFIRAGSKSNADLCGPDAQYRWQRTHGADVP